MKTKRYDGTDVRRILSSMITDPVVCSRISSQWTSDGMFDAKWANLIGNLVIKHFRRYGDVPNGRMTSIFEEWARDTTSDDKTIASIESFLQAMSDEARFESSDYILDLAGKYFNKVRIRNLLDVVDLDLEHGDVESADERVKNYRRVNLGAGSYVEPASDPNFWLETFTRPDRARSLVRYRGPLGEFFGPLFTRGSFHSFMGEEKIGKTTWLLDLVYRGIRNRNRVAFFDTGDSNIEEIGMRLSSRITGNPEYEQELNIPIGWEDDRKTPKFRMLTKVATEDFDTFRSLQKISKSPDALRMMCFPSGSAGVSDIDGILEDWSQENGWRPDIVVIDYADILAPPKGVRDRLEQIDETWMQLRRMSQSRHALVVTGTQISSSGYGKSEDGKLLSKQDFQGRRTKLAHVNSIIGINTSSKEKELGVSRINFVVRRKGRYSEKSFVRVAGCFEIANPAIVSIR